MTRNSRMPESLAADLDAECSACLMGARRLAELFDRYGRAADRGGVRRTSCEATTRDLPTEMLSKIPDGEYVWEDYAEHDGVDEPRLHAQRITLTKTVGGDGSPTPDHPGLHRHLAAGQGADQPLRRLRRRRVPGQVAGADPAQPRRHARSGWPNSTSTRASCR